MKYTYWSRFKNH